MSMLKPATNKQAFAKIGLYGNAGSGCGKCPIESECHGSNGHFGRLSDASLIEWRQRLNAAAEKVAL